MIKNKRTLSIIITAVFIFTMLFGSISAIGANNGLKDIKGHWAQDTIQGLVDEGIIAGYPDGTFKPNNNITRAEFATLIVRAFALEAGSGKVFNDTVGHWAEDAIKTANYHGVVSGYSDTAFGPNDPITREQIAVMIVNVTKTSLTAGAKTFTDSAQISGWAKDSVDKAATAGLIAGYPDGSFKPKANATRAESSVVLDRGMGLVIEEEIDDDEDEVITNYDRAGTYGPVTGTLTIDDDVIISADGVTLRNMIIAGNLIIAEEVGDGDVDLNNVTVKGETFIRGGGKDSIHIKGGKYKSIIIESTSEGGIRLVATDVKGLKITISEEAAGEEITLEGTFENVVIEADDLVLTTKGKTTIAKLTVDEDLSGVTVNTEKGTTVKELLLKSAVEVNNAKDTVEKASGDKVDDSIFANEIKPKTSGSGGGTTIIEISAISVDDVPVVGMTIRAKDLKPAGATVKYQWQRASMGPEGEYGDFVDIEGETYATYKVDKYYGYGSAADNGFVPMMLPSEEVIRLKVTGTGRYRGTVYSEPIGPVVQLKGTVLLCP